MWSVNMVQSLPNTFPIWSPVMTSPHQMLFLSTSLQMHCLTYRSNVRMELEFKAFAKLQFILLCNTKGCNIRKFNQIRTIKRGHILMKVFWWFHASENCLILKYIGFAGFDQFKYFRIDFFKPRLSENILRKFLNGRVFVPVVTGCPCHCTSHSVTQIGYCYFITL